MRSKQRDSLPEIAVRKGNRSVRASNFELSSSANDFDSTTNNERQSAAKVAVKSRTNPSNVNKSEAKQPDDNVLDMLKMDAMAQESYKLVLKIAVIEVYFAGFNVFFLWHQKQNHFRRQAEMEYNELKKQVEELQLMIEQERKNPTSEYDESIAKQQYFNETLRAQVNFFY